MATTGGSDHNGDRKAESDRKPSTPPPAQPDKPAETSKYLDLLYPKDDTTVVCRLCSRPVWGIPGHLAETHPHVTIEAYHAEYPDAPLAPKGNPNAAKPPDVPEVTAEEAAEHPARFDGALIEKQLPNERERKMFRELCKQLVDQGYPPVYSLAATALSQVMASRVRAMLAETQTKSGGYMFNDKNAEILAEMDARVNAGIKDLQREKLRTEAVAADPLTWLRGEMKSAEEFVRERIGEISVHCSDCGTIMTLPNLPHWAFGPHETAHGREWPVWSPELWKFVLEGTLRLWQMAYALRTSPEGLLITAQRRREENIPEFNLEEEEEIIRKRILAEDREFLAERPFLPSRGEGR